MSTLRSVVVACVDGYPEADGPHGFVKLPIGNDEYVVLSPETVNTIANLHKAAADANLVEKVW